MLLRLILGYSDAAAVVTETTMSYYVVKSDCDR